MTQRRDTSRGIQTLISRRLHNLLFLEEFVFARNEFKSPSVGELELADAVVMIGDVLLIYQIKERSVARHFNPDSERKWFEKKVLGQATKQIRDTLRYLNEYGEVPVPNERGHVFNLAGRAYSQIIKIVLYAPSDRLPDACRTVRHHVSGTAGFIHIIDVRDYIDVSKLLRVPYEVIAYLKFRESVLTRYPTQCASLSEAAIAGHFIFHDDQSVPTHQSATRLNDLVEDYDQSELSGLLQTLRLTPNQDSTEHYRVLLEFMKLPRSAWRRIKERADLCFEKVRSGQFARPYRMECPETDCGFIFIPVEPDMVMGPLWSDDYRHKLISCLVVDHKYDRRLSKCVGFMIGKGDGFTDTNWCMAEYAWAEDAQAQECVDQNPLLRPVKEEISYGYYVRVANQE